MYTPTGEEVEQARHLVGTFEESSRNSIVVDGVFLDTAIVDQYRTILGRDEADPVVTTWPLLEERSVRSRNGRHLPSGSI